ncbi:MAG: 30S ribosomal protein S19e [Candidatus Aenigmarchaeota archaeon]|nr:30S ribosomal protein S19e [Candidatus Aenigmarchaeota archaeon]
MVSARDADPQKLVEKTAEALHKEVQMPEWARIVKTGANKQRPPEQKDWWYLRSASVLKQIYMDGPVGVEKLRSFYGGRKRRGHKPPHFRKASGKIIRTILIDLEKLGYVAKQGKNGRAITPQGQRLLDQVAKQVK